MKIWVATMSWFVVVLTEPTRANVEIGRPAALPSRSPCGRLEAGGAGGRCAGHTVRHVAAAAR